MFLFKLEWLAVMVVLGIMPSAAGGAAPVPASERILDEKDPNRTRPLDPRDAANVDDLERLIEQDQADQDKLSSGNITKEEYDKSQAETQQRIAEVAAKNPESAPVQTSAARAYIQTGDYEKAVSHASQAMALAPNDPFPVTTRGMAYFKAKDFGSAAEDAKRALEIDPDNTVAQALWKLSKDRGSGPKIAGEASAARRRAPEPMSLPENPYAAQPALRADDEPEIARYKTEEGRRYGRQVVAVHRALRRKDYLTVYGRANAALTTYADNPRVLAARMLAAWALGDNRTAVSDASLVLKANPDWYQALTVRASAYNETGRHADALKDAEKAVALAPRTDGRPYLERAFAREGLGERAESVVEDFKRAAELDPRYEADYQAALDRLMPGWRAQAVAGTGQGSPNSSPATVDLVQRLMDRARKAQPADLWPAGAVLVLAAAGFMLARRT